jgi:hypothetical protein
LLTRIALLRKAISSLRTETSEEDADEEGDLTEA